MASQTALEIEVTADIKKAIESLKKLQEELQDVAEAIEEVDALGTEGISVNTYVEEIDDDLAEMTQEIEAWERINDIEIDTNVRGGPGIAGMALGGRAARVGGLPGVKVPGGGGGGGGDADVDVDIGMFRGIRRSIRELTDDIDDFKINMSSLHNVLASMVPILLVFLGTIPAIVTALVGLAAAAIAAASALLAIAGFGALGFAMVDGQVQGERLSQAWDRITNQFIDAFAPMAERLEPLFEDAISGLGRFFDAIAREGDALMMLTDEARAFGRWMTEFTPVFLRTLAAIAESMSGILGNLANWLQNNFVNAMKTLVELTAEVMPMVAEMTLIVGRAIPALVRLSIGFTAVSNAIMNFLGVVFDLLGMLGISEQQLAILVGVLLSVRSALALLSITMNSFVYKVLAGAISAIYTFILALVNKAMAAIFAEGAIWGLNQAIAALLTLISGGVLLGLVAAAASAATQFSGLAGNIGSAADELERFQAVQSGMGSGFGGPGDDPYGFDPEDPKMAPGSGGGAAVFNVESSGDPQEDRSNIDHADWMSGRTTGG